MTLASQPAFNRIVVDLKPSIVRVTLNNPPLNVIDLEMMGELLATLEQAETIPEVSTVVFAGSQRAFSTGVDIAAHTPDNVRNMLTAFHGVIKAVAATKKLTIASVCRHCLGGGAELALLCDVVYATPDSVWGFPEIKLACFPPVASVALASIVGQKLAAEMVLTGRTITGEEALAAGLVNGVAEDPESLVAECIARVTQLSPAALAMAKKSFYAWDSIHFDKGLARAEQVYLDELMQTTDAQEGIKAYTERRRPQWTGK
jgi:cyclohexa-1,5-dienecarbonyl-CoA hydratase